MKKQTVAQGALILLLAGFINRILGMVGRIILTRYLGDDGVGLYMLISPTMMLLMTLASIGLPVAIPTLISKSTHRQKKVLTTSLIIALTSSLVMSIILFFCAEYISLQLLKDERTYLPLLTMGPLLFVISISCILKGYFQGKQNMYPTAISNLIEQLVRIGLSVVFINWLLPYSVVHAIVGLLWASIIGEAVSVIILLFMFFSNVRRTYETPVLTPTSLSKTNFKDVLSIALPATGSRLIGSFTHFLEPILVVNCLYRIGYSSEVSAKLYGAVSGFALPLLLLPTFITYAISQAIIPVVSQAHTNRQNHKIHEQLSMAFRLSFLPGGFATILYMLFPYELMNLLFNTDTGANYLFIMAPVFLLLYFQGIFVSVLQAINLANKAMFVTLISSMIKILLMTFLMQMPDINILGLVIAILINLILTTLWDYRIVSKEIGYHVHFQSVFCAFLVMGITFMSGHALMTHLHLPESPLMSVVIVSSILLVLYLFLLFITRLLPDKVFSRYIKS